MNIEDEAAANPGWFSEDSVQHIIYDLWDAANEASNHDTLTLGFGPIHQVFTGAQKTTPAFTSIFSFIKSLKDIDSADSAAIDTMVANESIATIDDIYGGLNGTVRTNHASDYPYAATSVGGAAAQIHTTNTYGDYNKLGNYAYVKFTVTSQGTYRIKVQQTNGSDSDPDVYLYQAPHTLQQEGTSGQPGSETLDVTLGTGDYLLEVLDYNNVANAQYSVTVQ